MCFECGKNADDAFVELFGSHVDVLAVLPGTTDYKHLARFFPDVSTPSCANTYGEFLSMAGALRVKIVSAKGDTLAFLASTQPTKEELAENGVTANHSTQFGNPVLGYTDFDADSVPSESVSDEDILRLLDSLRGGQQ